MGNNRHTILIAVIYDETRNRILLSRRDESKHQGGLWEFPGGRAEPGETDWQTLSRELHEELGISAVSGRYYKSIDFDYVEIKLRIKVWFLDTWTGKPTGKEGQQISWVNIVTLHKLSFPPANAKIISMLQLPRLYLITPDLQDYGDEFYARVMEYLECGVRLLQFRNPSRDSACHAPILKKLQGICAKYDCTLMYNGTPDDVMTQGIRGLHLNSQRLMSLSRRPLNEDTWISTSCHDLTELKRAGDLGLDFCVISPVKKTGSHPDARPIGWDKFKALVAEANIPVYALGGMRSEDLGDALSCGAQGLAMISGIWDSPNACKEIEKLLKYTALD